MGDAARPTRAPPRRAIALSTPDPLLWLLEDGNPSARYLALTRLLGRSEDEPEVGAARARIPAHNPASRILAAQWPEGFWMRPGVGHSPRHKATVWQVMFLAALGAPLTPAIERGCEYVLENSRLQDGRFSAYKTDRGAVPCLNGNMLRALFQLGFCDSRVDASLGATLGMVHAHGFRCRFNTGGSPAPRMADGYPCAWGAIKVLGALCEVPRERQSIAIRDAMIAAVALLVSDYPVIASSVAATQPSSLWSRFGFPLGSHSDLLELLEVLARSGADLRSLGAWLDTTIQLVTRQRDPHGRWLLGNSPPNLWTAFGSVGRPNKWVTVRAMAALGAWGVYQPAVA